MAKIKEGSVIMKTTGDELIATEADFEGVAFLGNQPEDIDYKIEIGLIDPTTWKGAQQIVRAGKANQVYAVGDQLVSGYDGGQITWEVIGIDVDTPAESDLTHSMTIQTKDVLENRVWNSANDNRYINSPIRTYLNGELFNKIDPELKAVIGSVNKKVAQRNDLGGDQDSFSDKVFLLSRVEVGLGTEGDTTGEIVYPFYDGVANASRIKQLNGSPSLWWLRSPSVGNSNYVRRVHSVGSLNYNRAHDSIGVSPACSII